MCINHETTAQPGDADYVGFVPNYTPVEGTRVLRGRLRFDDGGTAEVTFRGQILANGIYASGDRSLYAEVVLDDSTATTVRVAAVPTGKRIPRDAEGNPAKRVGMTGPRHHLYVLEVDPMADRAAYDAEVQRRRDLKVAEQAAAEAQRMLDGLDEKPLY